ncbi:hypothetical protein [Glycomyces albidus]|uniref:Htaa domain-containing protein n=1 Tax=Glycomyces albidus TaxID=2656774 RepID=A0A6L5G4Y4_9ACTN|nr:hypothetical protein [Glycomyces albidus]MQM24698.1 hypothetical protein [Glycomyces albidus]
MTKTHDRRARLAAAATGACLALAVGSGAAGAPVAEPRTWPTEAIVEWAALEQSGDADEPVELEGELTAGLAREAAEVSTPIIGLSLEGESETYGDIQFELVGNAEVVLDATAALPPAYTGRMELTLKLTVEDPAGSLRAEQQLKGTLTAEGITSPAAFLEQPWSGEFTLVTGDPGAPAGTTENTAPFAGFKRFQVEQ